MLNFLFFLTLIAIPFCALSSPLETNKLTVQNAIKLNCFDNHTIISILELLDPIDLQSLRLTSQYFNKSIVTNSYLVNHIFDVTLPGGNTLTLKKYLADEKSPFNKIKNLSYIVKKKPDTFIKLLFHSLPQKLDTLHYDIQNIYQSFRVNDLIKLTPNHDKPSIKIAAIFFELELWRLIEERSRKHLKKCSTFRGLRMVRNQERYRIFSSFRNAANLRQYSIDNSALIEFLNTRFIQKIEDHIDKELNHLIASSSEIGMSQLLADCNIYSSTVYQFVFFLIRISDKFSYVFEHYSDSLSSYVDDSQAIEMLSSMVVKESQNPYTSNLEDLEKKILKVHLQ